MSFPRRTLIAALTLLLTGSALLVTASPASACEMWGSICVPPEAKAIIDAVPRTPASDNDQLMDALEQLAAAGVNRDEVLHVGLARFPIAGRVNYSHDWLYPRFGPGFRFHEGTDVFADYGTPIRSPIQGTAEMASNSLGGLSVKLYLPDGTYLYMAHLSGVVDGFTNGMSVEVGDVVGYVGTSGNAAGTPPHLHLGIYRNGEPIDPKPILDRWLAEAEARLPTVAAAFERTYGIKAPNLPVMPVRQLAGPTPETPSLDLSAPIPAAPVPLDPPNPAEVNAAAPKPVKRARTFVTQPVMKFGPVIVPMGPPRKDKTFDGAPLPRPGKAPKGMADDTRRPEAGRGASRPKAPETKTPAAPAPAKDRNEADPTTPLEVGRSVLAGLGGLF